MKTEQPHESKREKPEIIKLKEKENNTPENRKKFLKLAHGFLKKPMHTGIENQDDFVTQIMPRLEALLSDKDSEIFVMEQGGEYIGYATVKTIDALPGKDCMLREIYVKDDLQRSGAGTELMCKVEAFARENECSRISLATNWLDEKQGAFYRSLGFDRRCDFLAKKF